MMRPLRWLADQSPWLAWTVVGGTIVVTFALGAGGGDSADSADPDRNLRSQLKTAQVDARSAERERDRSYEEIEQLKAELAKATAKGEVPDFTGGTLAEAESMAATYDWKIRTSKRATEDAEPDTVLAQRPKAGKTLKAGRPIRLTLAKKPPPKPKQWLTIAEFSQPGKTNEFEVPDGKVRLAYDMPGPDNNAIELYQPPNEYVDLLVNEVGATSGETRMYEPGTYYMNITGGGTIRVQEFKRP